MSKNKKDIKKPVDSKEKAKNFKGTVKKLVRRMGVYKIHLIFVFIFAISGTVLHILGPKVLGMATTELFNGLINKFSGSGSIDFGTINKYILGALALFAGGNFLSLSQGLIMAKVSNKISYALRRDISIKLNRVPMSYFESQPYGEVLSRITNDVDTLQTSISQSLAQIIISITSVIGTLVMMFSINVWLTLVALLILPVSLIIMGSIMKFSQKYFDGQQKYLGVTNSQVEEVYGGYEVVKAFNNEETAIWEFGEVNKELYQTGWKSQFFSGIMMPIMTCVGNIGYVVVAVLGSFFAIKGTIAIGDIQAFFQYIRNFTQPFSQLAQITNMLQSTVAASERIFELLDQPEEIETGLVLADHVKGDVSFENIAFGYKPGEPIIHDFSAIIKAGQKVAIVGPTGAGKTTMIKLLMRFYDVDSGNIYIDDQSIDAMKRSELRKQLGMVLQDTWLFQGTIMENIRYGRLDATDEEVIEAAKSAFAHRFILEQPAGYQMVLNEETNNVSQGQKQLLTIARAILADSKILILDEATSSVDTRTELLIQQAMDRLQSGKTSFVIAHRLSTIRDADLILVMKDGDIIEQGTHDELIAENGFYKGMYYSQFESVEAV
jgi:ATP-binding cassette, subfamily B, multidrug efflux pump